MRRDYPWLWFLVLATVLKHAGICQGVYPGSPRLDARSLSGSSRLPSNSISHITVNRTDLWIGTGKGLARSTDGARTWQSFASVPQFARPGIFSIAAHGDTLWCSTGYTEEVNDQSVQTGAGYTYSTDNGQTWVGLPQTMDGRGDSLMAYGINQVKILPIVVPEQNVTFDVALTAKAVWIASWSSGIRKSTDLGATWQRVILPSSSRNSLAPTDSLGYVNVDPRNDNNYLGFAVAVENDSLVWAGTAGGVNRSTDGGISWTKYRRDNQLYHILSDWVIAIGIQHLASHTRVWTTNWPAEGVGQEYGISATDDGGSTWKNYLQGIKAYDFTFRDSIVYVATDAGLYRSDDGGLSWMKTGDVVDATSGNRLYAPSFYAAGAIADSVYGGSGEGLVKTIDNNLHLFGEEWVVYRAYQPLPGTGSAYAYPNPFSPRSEFTRIHYTTGSTPGTISIEVFDFGMNRVRTVLSEAARTGEHDELWDGRNGAGEIVPNGVYFYRVVISGQDPIWGKIMVLQ
jgi:photosystem II stability/assembly factor-like uncharacterized protein